MFEQEKTEGRGSEELPRFLFGQRSFVVRESVAETKKLLALGALSPFVARFLSARGMIEDGTRADYLEPRLADLASPSAMADRGAAVDRIVFAIRNKERIGIFGDYDVDGTTSASILADAIEEFGGEVFVQVANRFDGGYGLSEPALDRLLAERPKLIVTCDCGSSDHPRIERARKAGVDVVVVDHHLVPNETLPANAFLNPHRPECGFPYKGLCSAGLAFSLVAGVRAELGLKYDVRHFLDLVALGTIADVAPLTLDNRRLVRAGLSRIQRGLARPGIEALLNASRSRSLTHFGAVDVAFRLAPRINAAGRLADAGLAVKLLRARDREDAQRTASQLEELNDRRKLLQNTAYASACEQVEAVYGSNPTGGIVVSSSNFHKGVVGIVAAKLVDRYGCAALVLAEEGGHAHGSGRAPDGGDVYAPLMACKDLCEKAGGHRAAVGLTVASANINALREVFQDACSIQGSDPEAEQVDFVLREGVELPTLDDYSSLEPLGCENEEPRLILQDVTVVEAGKRATHLKLTAKLGDRKIEALGWDMGNTKVLVGERRSLLGSFRTNDWGGPARLEFRIDAVSDRE